MTKVLVTDLEQFGPSIALCLLQMSELLDGKYKDVVNKYIIVDARYPYEYEGGHIQVRIHYHYVKISDFYFLVLITVQKAYIHKNIELAIYAFSCHVR